MTRIGFFSIVTKSASEWQVRSRSKQDLQDLLHLCPEVGSAILDTPGRDYPYRIIVTRPDLDIVMLALAETVTYPNFKDAAARAPGQRQKPYHEVWAIMRDAAERRRR
jgi:hypothetical protein